MNKVKKYKLNKKENANKTYKEHLQYKLEQVGTSNMFDTNIESDLTLDNIYIELHLDMTSSPKFGYDVWDFNKDTYEWTRVTNMENWDLTSDHIKNKKEALKEALNYLINKQ